MNGDAGCHGAKLSWIAKPRTLFERQARSINLPREKICGSANILRKSRASRSGSHSDEMVICGIRGALGTRNQKIIVYET